MLRLASCSSLVFVAISLIAGCSGSLAEPDSGSGGSGLAPSPTTPPAKPAPSPSTDPGLEPEPVPMKPDATLAEIEARCQDATHGPVDTFKSFTELKGKLHGRWFACDRAAASGFYAREAGVQFNGNGTWNLIRREADGSFVTLQGIDNQGTWHEKYTDFLGYFQVNTTTGMVLTEFAFEDMPRRMRTSGDDMAAVWFVPMTKIEPVGR